MISFKCGCIYQKNILNDLNKIEKLKKCPNCG